MKGELYKKISTGIFLFLFIVLHLILISTTFFVDKTGNIHSNSEGYGDIPFHMTQVSKFAFGTFDLSNPLYLGQQLRYPFIINLLSGLLLRLTNAWSFSMLFPVMFLAIANILLLYLLYRKVLQNRLLAIVGIIIFFLGVNLYPYLGIHDAFRDNVPFDDFVATRLSAHGMALNLNTVYPDQNIAFASPLTMSFLHQRSFFPGMFAFLLFTCLLLKIGDYKKKNINADRIVGEGLFWNWKILSNRKLRFYILSAGIIYGLMPILHMHSFIAASILVFVVFIFSLFKRATVDEYVFFDNKEIKSRPTNRYLRIFTRLNNKYFYIIIIGVLIALPQIFFLVDFGNVGKTGGGFIQPRLGWMSGNGPSSVNFPKELKDRNSNLARVFSWPYFRFTVINFSVILPLFILALIFIAIKRKKFSEKNYEEKWIFESSITAILIFIVVESVQLQPWDFDNNKLLVYYQLLAVPTILWLAGYYYKKSKITVITALVLLVSAAVFSSIFDLVPRIVNRGIKSPIIFETNHIEFAEFIKKNIPADQMILTGTSHINPVSSLAGHQTLMSYNGWLWSMGISTEERKKEMYKFYSEPDQGIDFLTKYKIKYIVLNPQIKSEFNASDDVFDRLYTKIFEIGSYSLYKV